MSPQRERTTCVLMICLGFGCSRMGPEVTDQPNKTKDIYTCSCLHTQSRHCQGAVGIPPRCISMCWLTNGFTQWSLK